MGRQAYIHIQNNSSHTVSTALQDGVRVSIEEDDLAALVVPSLEPGESVPTSGEQPFDHSAYYQALEGETKFRFQKDGSFVLVVSTADGQEASCRFGVDKSKWWCYHDQTTRTESCPILLTADVEEDETQEDKTTYRIEVRIYNAFTAASWMEELAPSIESKPLCQVGIPGTHDSGTYQFEKSMGASPDSDLTMKIQGNLEGGFLGKIGGSALNDKILAMVFDRLCQCQDQSFQQQLEGGIRYLDLRIARHEDKFYTCHGVYCVDIEEALTEINDFLEAHPKEIVLLDINHLYGIDTDEHHKALTELFLNRLGSKVASNNKEAAGLGPMSTVGEFWKAGAQAVILYCHFQTAGHSDGRLWPPGWIKSPWPEAPSADVLHRKLAENVETRNTTKFFVLQGVLTPDGELIKSEILENAGTNTSIKSISSRVSTKVVDWVEGEWRDSPHNVIIMDFFQNSSMLPAIVNWNRK